MALFRGLGSVGMSIFSRFIGLGSTAGLRAVSSSSSRQCQAASSGTTAGQQPDPLTICTEQSGIRIITLNNTVKRNVLSMAMLKALMNDIEAETPDLRVIIIRGKGPVFSAGHDLEELTSGEGLQKHMDIFRKCSELMIKVQDVPVPVIAEVDGVATAAGCQLVASCDIAIASDISKFATPGVSVGVFCSTPGIALARSVPRKVAMEMLFTGNPISAQDALIHGLVSRVVPQEKLKEEVMKTALQICDKSATVTALGKQFFYQQIAMDRNRAYKNGEVTMVENLRILDSQEGIDAFLSKRKPKWRHTEERIH